MYRSGDLFLKPFLIFRDGGGGDKPHPAFATDSPVKFTLPTHFLINNFFFALKLYIIASSILHPKGLKTLNRPII